MSAMRLKIAEHMVMSVRTSPHVTTVHRVDMTEVAKMRERHKATFQANYGFSLTYLPFIARASVAALRQFPLLNASLDGNNIIYHNEINIGIAVALENGLIVPVIRNADEKTVAGLQRSIVDLAGRARSRQLKPDEIQGGTFSITNFGSFGSLGILAGSIISFMLLVLKAMHPHQSVMDEHGPMFVIGGVLIVAGIQMLAIGLLGELQVRHYYTNQQRTPYAVDRLVRLRVPEEPSMLTDRTDGNY